MEASIVRTRPDQADPAESVAWIVTVRSADGTEHEVRVEAQAGGQASPSQLIADVEASGGASAVKAALTADPTRIPKRITCGAEGSQPVYEDES